MSDIVFWFLLAGLAVALWRTRGRREFRAGQRIHANGQIARIVSVNAAERTITVDRWVDTPNKGSGFTLQMPEDL